MNNQVENQDKNQVTKDGITYVNLIGHEINDIESGLKIPGSRGYVARLSYNTVEDEKIGVITVNKTIINGVKNLPRQKPNTIYIVSALTIKGVPEGRQDIVSPGPVYKERKEVVGCQSFRRKE